MAAVVAMAIAGASGTAHSKDTLLEYYENAGLLVGVLNNCGAKDKARGQRIAGDLGEEARQRYPTRVEELRAQFGKGMSETIKKVPTAATCKEMDGIAKELGY
jgi:hypothetical protein